MALRASDLILARNMAIIRSNLTLLDAFVAGHADLFEWVRPIAGAVAFIHFKGPLSSQVSTLVSKYRKQVRTQGATNYSTHSARRHVYAYCTVMLTSPTDGTCGAHHTGARCTAGRCGHRHQASLLLHRRGRSMDTRLASAPPPPPGTPGRSGLPGTPKGRGERPSHWVPSLHVGCSSLLPPNGSDPAAFDEQVVTPDTDYFRVGYGEASFPQVLDALRAFVETHRQAWRIRSRL